MKRLLLTGIVVFVGLAGAGRSARGQAPESAAPVSLSPREMLASTAASIDNMRGMIEEINSMLKRAEERGDADGAQCLRDKKAISTAMVDVSLMARNAMQGALAQNNLGRAAAEFRKVEVAERKVDQFLAEAMGCIGDRGDDSTDVVRTAIGDEGDDGQSFNFDLDLDIGGDGPPGTAFQ